MIITIFITYHLLTHTFTWNFSLTKWYYITTFWNLSLTKWQSYLKITTYKVMIISETYQLLSGTFTWNLSLTEWWLYLKLITYKVIILFEIPVDWKLTEILFFSKSKLEKSYLILSRVCRCNKYRLWPACASMQPDPIPDLLFLLRSQ